MKLHKGLISLLLLFSATSCSNVEQLDMVKLPLGDKYRTFYEIFPGSYRDSNGDGIGDLNGITQKLDYISDLGYNGIWLTPIFTSSSYHKYDVTDYLEIDPSFGTMNDLDNLLSEAHERDIAVILDLVVNHSSNNNEWFKKGIRAFKNGGGEYADYYNFALEQTDICNTRDAATGVWYEAKFDRTMPDLNLDSQNVRNEIKNIMEFYLDKGVDGFRLDATTYYYTGDEDKNIEFLTWLNDTGKEINPNCYFVGEAWTNSGVISRYYRSGIDSFFAYDPEPLGKRINTYIIRSDGQSYYEKMSSLITNAGDGIPAPFIANHDNGRAASVLNSKRSDNAAKFGYGMMSMMTGTTFTYYGDEIGMVGVNPPDQNVRTAMFWGEGGTCKNPTGTTVDEHVYGSVSEQLKNGDSILNYYRKANNLRNKYEAIRKGDVEVILNQDRAFQVLKKTYGESSVYLLMNFTAEDLPGAPAAKEYDISNLNLGDDFTYEYLVVDIDDQIEVDGSKFTLPKQSIVVINGNN